MLTAIGGIGAALLGAARYGHDPDRRALYAEEASACARRLHSAQAIQVTGEFGAALDRAAELLLRGVGELSAAAQAPESVIEAMRAARYVPYAMELLYPHAANEPELAGWFGVPAEEVPDGAGRDDAGVAHLSNDREDKGGCSLYVPEWWNGDGVLPLVIALHGGSGHGRTFLWSWLRDARSRGVMLLSPTAVGDTWSLTQPDLDAANLQRMFEWLCSRWPVNRQRVLLTGMSDGGTFSLLGGLREDFPCTHLAPVSASFHPVMLDMVDAGRIETVPIHLTHGRYDWMFPVDQARESERGFRGRGAHVCLSELPDLAHTYPYEHNQTLLDWFLD